MHCKDVFVLFYVCVMPKSLAVFLFSLFKIKTADLLSVDGTELCLALGLDDWQGQQLLCSHVPAIVGLRGRFFRLRSRTIAQVAAGGGTYKRLLAEQP